MAELKSLIVNNVDIEQEISSLKTSVSEKLDISRAYPRAVDAELGLLKSITIDGDSSYYYPVRIQPSETDNYRPNLFTVSKTLGSQCASYGGNHSNGTSSCNVTCLIRNCGWNGNGNWAKTLAVQQPYANIVGDIKLDNQGSSFIVWLRGGGTSYRLYMDVPYTYTIYYSSTNIGSSTYPQTIAPTTSSGNAGVINTGNLI